MHYLISFLQLGYETDIVTLVLGNPRPLRKVAQEAGGQEPVLFTACLNCLLLPGKTSPPTYLSSQAEILSQTVREGLPLFTTGSGQSLSRGRLLLPPCLIPGLLGCSGG